MEMLEKAPLSVLTNCAVLPKPSLTVCKTDAQASLTEFPVFRPPVPVTRNGAADTGRAV